MGSFERSPSHRGSERTSSAARWHDDALAEIDGWQRGPSRPEAIRRLIEAELKAKREAAWRVLA
jgi:hypothetical protein